MPLIVSVAAPLFVTTTVAVALAPIATLPKLMLDGLTENEGVPETVTKLAMFEYALVPPLFEAETLQ